MKNCYFRGNNFHRLTIFLVLFLTLPILETWSRPVGENSISISEVCRPQETELPCLQSPVNPQSAVTWQSMLAQVAPGVRSESPQGITATKLNPPTASLRDVHCDTETNLRFQTIKAYRASDAMLILLDSSQCVILAAFGNKAPYPLLASLAISNMGGPEMGGLSHYFNSSFAVGSHTDVIEIVALHSNSSESWANHLLFMVQPGKLKLIYDGPSLYSYNNGATDSLAFGATLKALPNSRDGYKDIAIKVTEIKNRKATRSYDWTIGWNAAENKYMGGSKTLLTRINGLIKANNE